LHWNLLVLLFRLVNMSGRYSRSVRVFRRGEGQSSVSPSLFPEVVDPRVGPDHFVRSFFRLVERTLGELLRSMVKDSGGIRYDPVEIFCVLMYGMMEGEFSSVKLAERCVYDRRFEVLCRSNVPHYSTICRFRKGLEAELPELFRQIAAQAREEGLLTLRVVALDGTKLSGNASHVQVGLDVDSGLVAGYVVSTECNDSHQVPPALDSIETNCAALPEKVVADKGYDTAFNLTEFSHRGVESYVVPIERTPQTIFTTNEHGEKVCPAGHIAVARPAIEKGHPVTIHQVSKCTRCPLKQPCGTHGRLRKIIEHPKERRDILKGNVDRCQTKEGRKILRSRGPTIEGFFAHLKSRLKFKRFNLKNVNGASLEFGLLCLSHNLKTLAKA
jgi:transposase